ncbi:YdcF family protein [Hymenobacter persicinus]|uniref:YdcF family protein n=1 Tax=Hymenobacter persicinus TaxID=2025506 RepID=A0A4Q5L9M7_9BACT|nr:YdcF family protein [Hymenobacter persicinus]RYU78253.1 YdcF family protein [Hymenobacter persicinus]
MFFLLSKLLLYAILPVGIWLLVRLARNPRWRRWLLPLAIVGGVVGTNNALSNEALLAWELPAAPLRTLAHHDAAVLLTGITEVHKSPHDRVYLGQGADRFTNTLWLYRAGRIDRIIISGGSGAVGEVAHTEARDLYTLLRLAGVPRAHILLEERSRNTRENAQFTKELLARHPELKSLVLITSAFHQRRALGCFRRVGLTTTPWPADFRSTDRLPDPAYWLVPSGGAVGRWLLLAHEITGYVAYRIMGYC